MQHTISLIWHRENFFNELSFSLLFSSLCCRDYPVKLVYKRPHVVLNPDNEVQWVIFYSVGTRLIFTKLINSTNHTNSMVHVVPSYGTLFSKCD